MRHGIPWRTPHANIWKNASTMEERTEGGHTLNLQDQVRANPEKFPTPNASLYNLNESPESFLERAQFWKQRKGYHNHAPLSIFAKLFPTPVAADSDRTTETYPGGNQTLLGAVRNWPTPTASNGGANAESPAVQERGHGTNLIGAVRAWPTPTASSLGEKGKRVKPSNAREGGTLIEALSARRDWPTPSARNWKDTPGMAMEAEDGRDRTDQLARKVFATEQTPAGWWAVEPNVGRVVDGISAGVDCIDGISIESAPQLAQGKAHNAGRVHRLTALGNAVVPYAAEWIGWRIREAIDV